MSAKKNLTVAALAALLAVPAFGGISNINSVSANSLPMRQWNQDVQAYRSTHRGAIPSSYLRSIGITDKDMNYLKGHSEVPDVVLKADGLNPGYYKGNPQQSGQQSNNYGDNGNSYGTNDNAGSSDSTNGNTGNNANGSTQYASKNSLPQTGESNGNSKAMAMGAVALGASASMMALSMAKKHRQESELDSVSSEPTIDDGGDDKSNDDNADDIDTGYHMIMSDMFDNISKDLKQM